MSKREDGFYWVHIEEAEIWEVAAWLEGKWWVVGQSGPYASEKAIRFEVGRRIERDNDIIRERDSAVKTLNELADLIVEGDYISCVGMVLERGLAFPNKEDECHHAFVHNNRCAYCGKEPMEPDAPQPNQETGEQS